jgi:hypothetical protein
MTLMWRCAHDFVEKGNVDLVEFCKCLSFEPHPLHPLALSNNNITIVNPAYRITGQS